VGFKPETRREALLNELCGRLGYCSTGLVAADLTESMDADEITNLVIAREFGEDRLELVERRFVDEVRREVVAWLYGAKGAGSGLPF
jgi:hypothetical protein